MIEGNGIGAVAQLETRLECFVIMPISDPETYTPGHFLRVYDDLFVPACERAGYTAVRADDIRQSNLIHLDILQKILDSPMAICDLSSRNPNVLFELGLRQAFDKPVVLVQEVGTQPIFDIAPLRLTSYRPEMLYRGVLEDQASIAEAIIATKDAIGDTKSINSIVRLLGLTHAAAVSAPAEGDETAALLRVMMTEIGSVKAHIRAALQMRQPNDLLMHTLKASADIGTVQQDGEDFLVRSLTEREEEVLRLDVWRKTNQEIADELGISIKTVETHKANYMRKLGNDPKNVVIYALGRGWLQY